MSNKIDRNTELKVLKTLEDDVDAESRSIAKKIDSRSTHLIIQKDQQYSDEDDWNC